jgi:hypothetical protein
MKIRKWFAIAVTSGAFGACGGSTVESGDTAASGGGGSSAGNGIDAGGSPSGVAGGSTGVAGRRDAAVADGGAAGGGSLDGGGGAVGWEGGAGEGGPVCVAKPYAEPIPVSRSGSAPTTAWAIAAGGAEDDTVDGLAPLPDGGAVVVGRFARQIEIGLFRATPDLSRTFGRGWFLTRLDPSGNPIWLQAFPDIHGTTYHVAADTSGRLFVAGSLSGELVFGNLAIQVPDNRSGIFLAELSGNGSAIWGKAFAYAGGEGGFPSAYAQALAVDSHAGVVLAGSFQPGLDVDGIGLSGGTPQKFSLFIAAFDLGGSVRWAKRIQPSHYTVGPHVARLGVGGGRIAMAGWFGNTTDTIDFDGTTMPCDAAVVTTDYTGNVVWTLRGSGSDRIMSRAVSIAPTGDVGFFGHSLGQIAFGPTVLDSPEGWLMYVGRTNATGSPQFVRTLQSGGYGGIAPDGDGFAVATEEASSARNLRMTGIARDGTDTFSIRGADGMYPVDLRAYSGRLFLSGVFDGAIDLGKGRLDSHGCGDIVIARFDR